MLNNTILAYFFVSAYEFLKQFSFLKARMAIVVEDVKRFALLHNTPFHIFANFS